MTQDTFGGRRSTATRDDRASPKRKPSGGTNAKTRHTYNAAHPMLYHAYLDDSADRDRKRVVVSAAIVGRQDEWATVSRSWLTRLAEDGIEYFKSSQCDGLDKQFQKFRALGKEEGKRKAAQLRADLDAIIHGSRLMALGVTLSVPAHRAMMSDPQRFGPVPSVPYRLAFQQVIAECGKAMQNMGRGNVVTFAHDDTSEFEVLYRLYKDFKKRNLRYAGVLADFVRVDDKTSPPAQAADVAAYIISQFANNYVSDPNGDNLRRLRGRMHKIVNWLDDLQPYAKMSREDAPARAVYAP